MITKVDQKAMRILDGVTDSWDSCHAIIRRCYPKYKVGRDFMEDTFLMDLFNLADDGLIERQKRVVHGERGGEVTYVFRRVKGAEFKPKEVVKKMDEYEARDKILRAFFKWKRYLDANEIAKETGVEKRQCQRIINKLVKSGVVFRDGDNGAATYTSRDAYAYFMRGNFC